MRFVVGELAVVAVDANGNLPIGEIVEIIAVGPMRVYPYDNSPAALYDYRVNWRGEDDWYCLDLDLRKLNPPSEPASLIRQTELDTATS